MTKRWYGLRAGLHEPRTGTLRWGVAVLLLVVAGMAIAAVYLLHHQAAAAGELATSVDAYIAEVPGASVIAPHLEALRDSGAGLRWLFIGVAVASFAMAFWLSLLDSRMRRLHRALAETNARMERTIEERTRELSHLANTDPLTQLNNRRAFFKHAEREIRQAREHGKPVCALLIDADHFKPFNDNHGHHAGDRALRALARRLVANLRDHDVCARLGGEEFAALLPGTDLKTARRLAEQYCDQVSRLVLAPNLDARVTVSIGVAQLAPGKDMDDLLIRADAALYRAKARGRNRVEVAGNEPTQLYPETPFQSGASSMRHAQRA